MIAGDHAGQVSRRGPPAVPLQRDSDAAPSPPGNSKAFRYGRREAFSFRCPGTTISPTTRTRARTTPAKPDAPGQRGSRLCRSAGVPWGARARTYSTGVTTRPVSKNARRFSSIRFSMSWRVSAWRCRYAQHGLVAPAAPAAPFGLVLEHVQGGPAELARFQRGDQRGFVDDRAARCSRRCPWAPALPALPGSPDGACPRRPPWPRSGNRPSAPVRPARLRSHAPRRRASWLQIAHLMSKPAPRGDGVADAAQADDAQLLAADAHAQRNAAVNLAPLPAAHEAFPWPMRRAPRSTGPRPGPPRSRSARRVYC